MLNHEEGVVVVKKINGNKKNSCIMVRKDNTIIKS